MTKNLARIGLRDNETVLGATADVPPRTLSQEGSTFWEFMYDRIPAIGNDPRVEFRSKLIAIFRDDLQEDKRPDERFMEEDHGYIQWFFPLETRGVNPDAPIVTPDDYATLGGDVNLRARVFEHFRLFSEFMGIEYNPETGEYMKVNGEQWASWINNGHNNLRISRVLTSLKDFGLEQVAIDFLTFLKSESERESAENVGGETFIPFNGFTKSSCNRFWSKALE